MEVWKDIKEYEGYYQVSNKGRVKSVERIIKGAGGGVTFDKLIKERIMKQQTDKYSSVVLTKDGIQRRFSVHRLVAKAFIPNPDNLPQINHKDECKINNSVENLEWCSFEYNTNYGTRKKRMSEKALINYKKRARDEKGRFVS